MPAPCQQVCNRHSHRGELTQTAQVNPQWTLPGVQRQSSCVCTWPKDEWKQHYSERQTRAHITRCTTPRTESSSPVKPSSAGTLHTDKKLTEASVKKKIFRSFRSTAIAVQSHLQQTASRKKHSAWRPAPSPTPAESREDSRGGRRSRTPGGQRGSRGRATGDPDFQHRSQGATSAVKEDQEGKTAGRSQGDLNVTQVAWNRREPPGEKMSTGVVIIIQREGTGGGRSRDGPKPPWRRRSRADPQATLSWGRRLSFLTQSAQFLLPRKLSSWGLRSSRQCLP